MSPTVLHLLGRWKDAQLVFPLPPRPDLWRRAVNEQELKPYIVVVDLMLCTNDQHPHFITAETAPFPGDDDRALNRNRPEPEFYNWTPLYRENTLLNWNLDAEEWEAEAEEHFEDVGLVADSEGESERGDRVRRQAPPATPPPQLEQNQVQIQLICRGPIFKVEVVNAYKLYLKSVVLHLASKQVPIVREYFQNIWKPEHSWNVQLIPANLGSEERYKVRFTVPAHGVLIFNDVSLMQAMGFDSVGTSFRQDPLAIRSTTKSDGSKIYYWNNNSNKARVYESLRSLPNKSMFKLRQLAEQARTLLPASVLASAPKITTEGTEDVSLPFNLQFEYPKSMLPVIVENTLNIRPSMGALEKMTAYQTFFQNLLTQMALKDQLDETAFYVEIVNNSYLQFVYQKTGELNYDRFSVRMNFGYDAAVQLTFFEQPQLEWNLGRQSSKAYKMLYTAEEMEAHREAAVQQEFQVETVDPEGVRAAGGATAVESVVTSVDPMSAGAGAEGTDVPEEILPPTEQIDPATVARGAEQILPPTEIVQPTEEQEPIEETPTGVTESEKSKAPAGAEVEVEVIEPTAQDWAAKKKADEEARAEAARKKAEESAKQAEISQKIKEKKMEEDLRRQREMEEARMADVTERQRKADAERDRQQRIRERQERKDAEERQRLIEEAERRRLFEEDLHRQQAEDEMRRRIVEEEERQRQQGLEEAAEEEERLRQILLAEAVEEQAPVQVVDPAAVPAPAPVPAPVPAPAPAGAGDAPVNPYLGEPLQPADQGTFRRDRLRYLVGNTRRKRRMPPQDPDYLDRPENLILILDNSDKQNDFIYEWGRCCVAANIQGNKVTSKTKCFVDVRNEQELIFNLLDSQHLCLVRSPAAITLAKIELHVYV